MRSVLCALVLFALPAAAAPVQIGGTTFELGENAFPTDAQCIDAGGCAGDLIVQDQSGGFVGRAEALLGHELGFVVFDMDDTDEFRLTFPQPIVNLPGDDLYLAQAEFTGDPELEDGVHAMQIRLTGSGIWYTIASGQFGPDAAVGFTLVRFSDQSESKTAAYSLRFETLDLADFGFAPGQSITSFDIRGLAGAGGGLDTALVGSLNVPEPGTSALLGVGILGLALARRRRGAVA